LQISVGDGIDGEAMKTIVAAVDFSNATPGVLETAGKLAKAFGAQLHLIHIIEPQVPYTAYGFTPDEFPAVPIYDDEVRIRAGRKLEELRTQLGVEIPGVNTQLVDGSPLHATIDYVKEVGADLVILGAHGHGVVASLLLGSVAEGMVRKAVVPTLIVPAAEAE
jgi:nucleotide-binding universal stress UspA family protein